MDQTVVKKDAHLTYFWAVPDADYKEVIALYSSYQRNIVNALIFPKVLLDVPGQAGNRS